MKFSCILCKGQEFFQISKKTRDSKIEVVQCNSCSHIQLYPLPSKQEEERFYNQDVQTRSLRRKFSVKDLEKISLPDTQRRIRLISESASRGKTLLDIGTGYGFFLKAAKEAGFNPTGLEVGTDRLKVAKTITKVPIWNSRIAGKNTKRKKFDLITLFHVLEHVEDPIKLCQDLSTYLNKKGSLIIEVPNTDHYLNRVFKEYQDFYWQRAHLSYFTPTILREVLKEAGFRKIKLVGIQRYSFINSINWIIFKKPQLKNPSYETKAFALIDYIYKKILKSNLKCDTLWIEAKV